MFRSKKKYFYPILLVSLVFLIFGIWLVQSVLAVPLAGQFNSTGNAGDHAPKSYGAALTGTEVSSGAGANNNYEALGQVATVNYSVTWSDILPIFKEVTITSVVSEGVALEAKYKVEGNETVADIGEPIVLMNPEETVTATILEEDGVSIIGEVALEVNEKGKKEATFSLDLKPIGSADLSALTVNPGTLSPAFNPAITAYTVFVDHSVSTMSITATLADVGAVLMINGDVTGSGSAKTVSLNPAGQVTVINIEVVAADGVTKKAYTVIVNRADISDPKPEPDPDLDRIWVKDEIANVDALALAYNSKDELTGAFPYFGVWHNDGNGWEKLVSNDAYALAYDHNDNLAGAYSGAGVWVHDGQYWMMLADNDATALAYNAEGELTANFSGSGIYHYDGAGWAELEGTEADALAYNASGNLVASFPGAGVYERVNDQWVQLGDVAANTLAAGNELAGSFPGFGIYVYDGEPLSWTQLADVAATTLTYNSKDDLAGAFGLFGVWYYVEVE